MVHFKKFFDSMELLRKICEEVKMHQKLWCPESRGGATLRLGGAVAPAKKKKKNSIRL